MGRMVRGVSLGIVIAIALNARNTSAQGFLPELNAFMPPLQTDETPGSPNETIPAHAQALLAGAPAGAILAVGTERALLDAVMAPNATHVLVLDCNPAVAHFHEINTALLKISRDRQDYLNLRLGMSPQEWRQRASHAPNLDLRSLQLLQSPESHAWWSRRVRSNKDNWSLFHRAQGYHFAGMNYLWNDAQFARIKRLADTNRIQALRVDLGDAEAMAKVRTALDHAHIPLSVLDVSNAWEDGYISHHPDLREFRELIDRAQKMGTRDSVLLLTRGIRVSEAGKLNGEFGYLGTTFGNIESRSPRQDAFLNLLVPLNWQRRDEQPIDEFARMNPHLPYQGAGNVTSKPSNRNAHD